jgi:hypothetical protein
MSQQQNIAFAPNITAPAHMRVSLAFTPDFGLNAITLITCTATRREATG